MTSEQLTVLMVEQLGGFVPKDAPTKVTRDTVFGTVLGSATDGQSPATVYKQLVQMACKLQDQKLKKWPAGWVEKTPAELAPVLVPEEPAPAEEG